MRKYWNALLYGNAKTKRILWSVIGVSVFMVAGGIVGALGGGAVWYLFAVFALIMDIVLLQSVRLGEVSQLRVEDVKKNRQKNEIMTKQFDSLADITKEDLEQLLVAYKVNKAHVPVMIDAYEKEKIYQCPAYLWKDKGYLQMLVLEEKPRNLAIPFSQIWQITYEKDVQVNPHKEYEQMRQPSVVNMMFQQFMPAYKERQRPDGRKVFTKNLYVADPGIKFTNTSMKNVCKVLQIPISFDNVLDDRYGMYYREAFKTKLLLMDQVLEADEYKEKISAILKSMAEQCPDNQEFCDELERMVRVRVVTREVANYFMDYRQKLQKAAKQV